VDVYYYDDPVDEPVVKNKKPKAIFGAALLLFAGGLTLNTTLAANVSLNSGVNIQFGQGVQTTTACSGATILTVTPTSTFLNASGGGSFYFSSVSVANIPASCHGKDFTISAYNSSSSNPLPIFNSNATKAVVYNNAGTFQLGEGTTEGASITNPVSGKFTLTFTSPVALSTTVTRLTIQSSNNSGNVEIVASTQVNYDVGDIGPGGGKIFYKSMNGFSCGADNSATGSPEGGLCYFLEVAPANWSGGTDPDRPWATGTSSYYYDAFENDPVTGEPLTADRPGSGNATQDVTGLTNEDVYNINTVPGKGYKNSLAIVAQGNGATTAAGAARAYRGGSKSDWYLPSSVELNYLCQWSRGLSVRQFDNCVGGTPNSQSGGGFAFSTDSYASSSEVNRDQYWAQKMDGSGGALVMERKKSIASKVRPIRAFGLTYELGDTGPGGGKIFYMSYTGFSCGTTYSDTGSPTSDKCYFLEIAPSSWTGGGDPEKPWAIAPYLTSDIAGIDNYSDELLNRNNSGDKGIGLGYRNSIRIIAQGNTATSAAATARAYSGGGKGDWYLPTDTEINLVCQWAHGTTVDSDEIWKNNGIRHASLLDDQECDVGQPLNSGAGQGAGLKTDKYYWSSTEQSGDYATLLWMDGQLYPGSLGGGLKSSTRYVRPIRAF